MHLPQVVVTCHLDLVTTVLSLWMHGPEALDVVSMYR